MSDIQFEVRTQDDLKFVWRNAMGTKRPAYRKAAKYIAQPPNHINQKIFLSREEKDAATLAKDRC